MMNDRLKVVGNLVHMQLEPEIVKTITELTGGNLDYLKPHLNLEGSDLQIELTLLQKVDIFKILTDELPKPLGYWKRLKNAILNRPDIPVDQIVIARSMCLSRILFENMSLISNNLNVYSRYYDANAQDYQFLFSVYNHLKNVCSEPTLRMHFDHCPQALRLTENDVLMTGSKKTPS